MRRTFYGRNFSNEEKTSSQYDVLEEKRFLKQFDQVFFADGNTHTHSRMDQRAHVEMIGPEMQCYSKGYEKNASLCKTPCRAPLVLRSGT